MYLWTRHYATPDYQPGGLTRMLYGWVARGIGYHDAMANFARLSKLQLRLDEQADGLVTEAQARFGQLKAADEKAQTAAGLDSKKAEVETARAKLEEITSALEANADHEKSVLFEQAALAEGRDPTSVEALAILSASLESADARLLQREAAATPFPEDDAAVTEIRRLAKNKQHLLESRPALAGSLSQENTRLNEMNKLRTRYRRSGYDAPNSTFGGGSAVPAVLEEFVRGAVSSGALWDVLRQVQSTASRSRPDFGSGGFGRGSVWRGGSGFCTGGGF